MKVDHVRVADWMRENWKTNTKCPICGTDAWNIGEDVIEIREFTGHYVGTGGNIYPYVQLSCTKCGYTLFFNALIAGIVDPESFVRTGLGTVLQKKKEE